MAQAAALNWITFIKALTASLLAESWECHFPNPTYRFQDLTSPRTNVAFQFRKNDFIYCWKPLQHFRGKATKKNMVVSDSCVSFSTGWIYIRLAGSAILPKSRTALLHGCVTAVARPPSPRASLACVSQARGPGLGAVQGMLWCFSLGGQSSSPRKWTMATGRAVCDRCVRWSLCAQGWCPVRRVTGKTVSGNLIVSWLKTPHYFP